MCEQFTNTLSNEGREELAAWLSGDVSSIFNAKRRYQRGGDDLIADAQQYFGAQQADDTSGDYSQAVAFVSISLFFAGISLVISRTNARKGLLVLATLFIVGPLAFMATLPIA